MNEQLITLFLDKKNIFAVVGVSRDPEKFGHQVYRIYVPPVTEFTL
ncbi:MAG: hypothetical protein ACP5JW_07950 [Candidatus Bathyarchaeia archaeon]